jgi:hypothetical protein
MGILADREGCFRLGLLERQRYRDAQLKARIVKGLNSRLKHLTRAEGYCPVAFRSNPLAS